MSVPTCTSVVYCVRNSGNICVWKFSVAWIWWPDFPVNHVSIQTHLNYLFLSKMNLHTNAILLRFSIAEMPLEGLCKRLRTSIQYSAIGERNISFSFPDTWVNFWVNFIRWLGQYRLAYWSSDDILAFINLPSPGTSLLGRYDEGNLQILNSNCSFITVRQLDASS